MNNDNDFVIESDTLVSYKGNNRNIIIPDGVTTIGRRAFFLKTFIESVTIPSSVTVIEKEAFRKCSGLKNLTIFGNIKKLGVRAFDLLYDRKPLELYLYSTIPITAFAKSDQENALQIFTDRFSEFDKTSDVFSENIRFIGKNLKQIYNVCEYLIENGELRLAILSANAIPPKDLEWLTEVIQEINNRDLIAEILEYKNRLLSDEKIRKSLEKAAERAEKKALSGETSPAEWRKRLKFSYKNEDIIIKEVKTWEPVTVIPANIGKRRVRAIDENAIDHWCKQKKPDKLMISEGIEEIRPLAFLFAKNIEIFFPNTVKVLPEGCFNVVSELTLHIPASVTEIVDKYDYNKENPIFKAIHAPAGSYAEKYAKEHNIPFIAE